jgi:predicted small metal-binding protein
LPGLGVTPAVKRPWPPESAIQTGRCKKAKVIRCRDVGFDCEGVVRAETEEEALAHAAAHAQEVHGLSEITGNVVQAVQAAMRDE